MDSKEDFALVLAKSHLEVNNLFTLGPGSEHTLLAHTACLVLQELGL